jgi:hypothetical protein
MLMTGMASSFSTLVNKGVEEVLKAICQSLSVVFLL